MIHHYRRARPRVPTCKFAKCGGSLVMMPLHESGAYGVACLSCGRVPGSLVKIATPAEQLETKRLADGRRRNGGDRRPFAEGQT